MHPTVRAAGVIQVLLAMVIWQATSRGEDPLRAYPEKVPEDTSFETVTQSQPFPPMKYPVPIVGAMFHPEEVHVTPAGALVVPRGEPLHGLYLSVLVGSAPAGTDQPGPDPAPPPVEGVASRLVGGYMPGIENTWRAGDLQLKQTVIGTLAGGGFESRTGREPLVAVVRYSLASRADSPRRALLCLQFGEAVGGHSVRQLPQVYPDAMSFEAPLVLHADKTVAAAVISRDARASFKPLPPVSQAEREGQTVLNPRETSVQGADYTFDIRREGGVVRVGDWQSAGGADLYVESSRTHGVPIAVALEVLAPDGQRRPIGILHLEGLSADSPPAGAYIPPGRHSRALSWATLSEALPEGTSQVIARCYYTAGGERRPVIAWQPLVHLVRPGVRPQFRNRHADATDENQLRFELELSPNESRSIDVAVPYFPLPAAESADLRRIDFDERLKAFEDFWRQQLNRHAEFIVPEPRIRDAYRACLANNLLLTDREPQSGVLMPHPDPTSYEAVWSGDSGVIIQAMDRAGYHGEAAGMLEYFLARQGHMKPEGDVESAEGFFAGDVSLRWMNQNGFILWALAEHYKLTHDTPWLRRVAPQMVKACEWIVRERARTKVMENGQKTPHHGLLPKGRPSDLDTWDHWYWSDTYTYMGLRGAADVLGAAGMPQEAERFTAEADDYKACIQEAVRRSMDPNLKPPFVPPTPYRKGPPGFDFFYQTWYSICSPIYMVEAGLLDARGEVAGGINHWLEKHGLYSGMPAFGNGFIDPYYVYNQSLAQLLRGESAKFVWTLYSISAYAMGPGTYATLEGHNLVSGFNGEGWDANRQPHMHSNSRFMGLVRIALVLEEGEQLHLLAGTPRGWLADGQRIEVKRAPTLFGEVGLAAESRAQAGELRFRIEPPTRAPAELVLHVRPPTGHGILREVLVDGAAWKNFDAQQVRLGRRAGATEVVCRLGPGR